MNESGEPPAYLLKEIIDLTPGSELPGGERFGTLDQALTSVALIDMAGHRLTLIMNKSAWVFSECL